MLTNSDFRVGDRVALTVPGYSNAEWYGNEGEVIAIGTYILIHFDHGTWMERNGYNNQMIYDPQIPQSTFGYQAEAKNLTLVSGVLSSIPEPNDSDII